MPLWERTVREPKNKTEPAASAPASPEPDGKAGSRAALVYRALRRAIIEQALMPGSKLPEDAIGERLGVSRTLVREALARLATEGLVELRHNRGATVAYPSLEEARDVFAVRRAMERLVVEELCGRLTRAQAQTLEAHVAAEDRAQGRNGPESIRLAGEFHLLLAAMTGNALLERYVNEVASRCSLILAIYGRPHSSECAVNEHRELIAALASGDAARATHLMDHHLEAVMGRALIKARAEPDIRDVLAAYAETEGLEPGPARTPPKARSRART
ncbi:GntR family transcriptional regulator [Prosthecomicrobium hirschii]|nr:GntR family transcriptional regulator [Prosthecomicrobium hirschii]